MAKKNQTKQNPVVSTIIAIIVVVIGGLIYAVTGVDLLGTNTTEDTRVTVVATQASGATTGDVQELNVGVGFGYASSFWQVYFTTPSEASRDRNQWVNGPDVPLAEAIGKLQNTLDIAAFEMNNEAITEAILAAHERGVKVRIVTDNEHGIEDDDTTLVDLELAGIPIVNDERSALMHNKFMIMDSISVWTGSMNYTMNGVYRNNNNMIMMRSRRAVEVYQAEFNEMFERHEFGPRSDPSNTGNFSQDGVPIQILFASENDTVGAILREINASKSSIRFMSFSFTRDDMGDALMQKAKAGIDVQGVFENTGSETQFSEFPRLFCAGISVRQDGNPGVLHHKVFVIDGSVVLTGSFNFSNNAVDSNDENLLIVRDANIAKLFLEEFARVQSIATTPASGEINC
jgi:phosphatidylserine/phosphatidylglycerophosphate/cardiolipin synthase-like enzyme